MRGGTQLQHFEGWFSTYSPAGKGDKQRARDAYASGMGDPLVVARDVAADTRAEDIKAARDQGFSAGTVAALAVVHGMGHAVCWGQIVRAAGAQAILQHALGNEGDWAWAGFSKLAEQELGADEVRQARVEWGRARQITQEGGSHGSP